jgi:alpha-tubulin suppressor-like RCC1 family protein
MTSHLRDRTEIKGKPSLLLVFAVVTLVCALARGEAGAQAITVTPADSTISAGQTQQFTATGIDTPIAIEAGSFHQCALLLDSTLRCWGPNDYGQLGNGTFTSSPNPTPVVVAGITGAAQVAGGGFHTCARFPDGALRCWGRNSEGQLGDPATTAWMSGTPVPVSGIDTATQVTGGGFHTCALLQDGTVRCWGQNDYGQLGNGTISSAQVPNPTPVEVSGITTAIAVTAGGYHACALLQNGTVRCWGQNDYGQLGDGAVITPQTRPPTPRPTPNPVEVRGITTAVAVKAGIFHTCALLRDGTMQCWGWNDYFQLGEPAAVNASSTPVTVSGITPAALAPGAEHTCVLLRDATVDCWGDNNYGQNGNGSERRIFAPPTAAVTGITTATAVTSGAEHSCALLTGGTVQCWGRGGAGRLGNGSTTDAFTPVTVVGLGVRWTSSDPTVATIDGAGLAVARRPGVTTITATSGDRSGSTTLTVADATPVTRFILSVDRQGTGSGMVTSDDGFINCGGGGGCSASYDSGTGVTLRATPTAGSIFGGWSGCDAVSDTTCTVTMSAARSVTATFTRPRFTLVVATDGLGSGTVISTDGRINCGGGGACSASYDSGSRVILRATAGWLSTFDGWSGGGCSGTGDCVVTLGENTTVTARFRLLGLF